MLDHETGVGLAKRLLALHESGTTDQAPSTYRMPTSRYVDPDRFALEMERIFRRVPLPLALSCELREPGAYKALDAAGVPVLIVRGDDGALRAFVNSCRHRGSPVVGDGCGETRRFTCPYHAWSYDRSGCGIMPRTLRWLFTMPAILFSEPFGFASGVTCPFASAYRKTT